MCALFTPDILQAGTVKGSKYRLYMFAAYFFLSLIFQIMNWYNNGLPRDKNSTENAIFVKKARKWPLFIDPQFQAVR